MKFAVKRYWEVCDEVELEADSAGEAIETAHAMPLDDTNAQYVPDSMNSDPESDVEQMLGGVP